MILSMINRKTITKIILIWSFLILFYSTNGISQEITVPVAIDKLNLREEPDEKSKIIRQLSIGDLVKTVKSNNEYITINNKKGKWVYIKIPYAVKKQYGWVFDYYLGYSDRFTRIAKWNYKNFFDCSGDYCPSFSFQNDGKFTVCLNSYFSEYDGQDVKNDDKEYCNNDGGSYKIITNYHSSCTYNGELYKYLDLIWGKCISCKKSDSFYYLMFIKNSKLCIAGVSCGKE